MKRESHAIFKRNIDELRAQKRRKEMAEILWSARRDAWGNGWDAACFEVGRGNHISPGERGRM